MNGNFKRKPYGAMRLRHIDTLQNLAPYRVKIVNAEADAQVFSVVGKPKAENTLAVGTAEAEVIQRETTAVGQSNYALIEVGRALAEAKIPLVPQIIAGGNGTEGSGSLVNVLLANLVSQNLAGANKVAEPELASSAKV